MCASQNIGMLIVGRVINGISVGICSAQVPVYISELAPPSKRGRVVGAQQWAITWGMLNVLSPKRPLLLFDLDKHALELTDTRNLNYVLHVLWLQFHWRPAGSNLVPGSLGPPDDTCYRPPLWYGGHARITQVVGEKRPLGGGRTNNRHDPRERQFPTSVGSGRTGRYPRSY